MTIDSVNFPIIGFIRSPLTQKFGIPRQPNLVAVPAILELVPPFDNPLAFEGLEQFSHLWVLWQFHHNRDFAENVKKTKHDNLTTFRPQVRPPRLGGNEKIGVFATRSMYRPANIGLSVVKLEEIVINDNRVSLAINGSDMVDGTPVIDIKPYITYSDSVALAKSGFATDQPHKKNIKIDDTVHQKIQNLANNELSQKDLQIICELLAQDPRPAYRQQEIGTQFKMRYRSVDVVFFQQDENTMIWKDILPIND